MLYLLFKWGLFIILLYYAIRYCYTFYIDIFRTKLSRSLSDILLYIVLCFMFIILMLLLWFIILLLIHFLYEYKDIIKNLIYQILIY